MENYIFLKKKILKNCTETEIAVLNYDDPIVKAFADNSRAKHVWFSLKEKVDGAYLYNDELYYKDEKVMSVSDLSLVGEHNVQNALASIVVAKVFGVTSEVIAKALSTFKGVKHRIETIAEVDGITYIDDSKATNVDATIKAVSCMNGETVLLLGGKDKGYDYVALFSAIKNLPITQAILYGENRLRLLDGAIKTGYRKITLCDRFSIAVQLARLIAKHGQTVLLSPASASFDEFSGYEERGDKFVEMVRSFEERFRKGELDNTEVFDNTEGEIE
jgi:UDP-N-acetylmuramoylalanine--D-glutamate ligase